jgi:hypothetical protein
MLTVERKSGGPLYFSGFREQDLNGMLPLSNQPPKVGRACGGGVFFFGGGGVVGVYVEETTLGDGS